MVSRFSSAKNALAICDICGFTYKLRKLRDIIRKGKNTNIKACPECWSPDHPQLKLGEFPVNDPQALRDPRPDSAELEVSRNIQFGFDPVGLNNPFGLTPNNLVAVGFIGNVTVSI
jgi:hypothetical protein|tara:strand:+ start:834 stop:1181 length:348 start_codon:yes stop_codon:yes gene_type:complete